MKKSILFIFFLTVFIAGFFPVRDTDFGWHYRCGNEFISDGKLCTGNSFSYFLPHYQAYYTGHVYDIALAALYNTGGFLLIALAGALLLVFSAALVLYLFSASLQYAFFAYAAIFLASYPVFRLGLRPQIISFSLFLLVLAAFKSRKISHMTTLPFLFFIWVNLHIGFFTGLIALAVYSFIYLRQFGFRYVLIVLLSFSASLINPFGIRVYYEIYRHAVSPLSTMIAEWMPPTLYISIGIAGILVTGLFLLARDRWKKIAAYLLMAVFGILAIRANRNIPYFMAAAALFYYPYLKKFFAVPISSVATTLSIILLFTAIIHIPSTWSALTSRQAYCFDGLRDPYPCKALTAIKNMDGNFFTLYEWGGFLIWKKPGSKVFVDGRMPAWKDEKGKSPYRAYLEIIQAKPGWNETLKSLNTDYIFITNGTFLDLLLAEKAHMYGWSEIYRDDYAVIYRSI